jgi:hypothetical protein
MPVQTQYQPYWQKLLKGSQRINAILSETNVDFTKERKLETLANAHRYIQSIVTALEQYIRQEGEQSSPNEDVDSPLIPTPPPPQQTSEQTPNQENPTI